MGSQMIEALETLHQRVKSATVLQESFNTLSRHAWDNPTEDLSCSSLAMEFIKIFKEWLSVQKNTLPKEPQMNALFDEEALNVVYKELEHLYERQTGQRAATALIVDKAWKRYHYTKNIS